MTEENTGKQKNECGGFHAVVEEVRLECVVEPGLRTFVSLGLKALSLIGGVRDFARFQ